MSYRVPESSYVVHGPALSGHSPFAPPYHPNGSPAPMMPGIDVLARRLSQVKKEELQRLLGAASRGSLNNEHMPGLIATMLVGLLAKGLQRQAEEVYVSQHQFDADFNTSRNVSGVTFSYRVGGAWTESELSTVLYHNPHALTELQDVLLLALEKYHPEPVLPPKVEVPKDDEVLDRLARIEDSLRQQQSTTLTLATISGWLLRAAPPSVWESGGAETVRLVGGLADAVSPWPDESPAAAEASLRAARTAGALIEGPGPCVEPSDAVKGWALNHPQQALELSRHLAELAFAGAAGGRKGRGKRSG